MKHPSPAILNNPENYTEIHWPKTFRPWDQRVDMGGIRPTRVGIVVVLAALGVNDEGRAIYGVECACCGARAIKTNAQIQSANDKRRRGCKSCAQAERGQSRHHAYSTWSGTVDRCHNHAAASYQRYGARGIAVDPIWREDPLAFFQLLDTLGGVHGVHQIDRKNNDDGYHPLNVRLADTTVQDNNRSNTRYAETPKGDMPIMELVRGLKPVVSETLVRNRIIDGWEPEKAAKTPARPNTRKRSQDIRPQRVHLPGLGDFPSVRSAAKAAKEQLGVKESQIRARWSRGVRGRDLLAKSLQKGAAKAIPVDVPTLGCFPTISQAAQAASREFGVPVRTFQNRHARGLRGLDLVTDTDKLNA